jgi:hypothetical protein
MLPPVAAAVHWWNALLLALIGQLPVLVGAEVYVVIQHLM